MTQQREKANSLRKQSIDVKKLDIQFHLKIKSRTGHRYKTKSLHRDTQKSQENYQSIVQVNTNQQQIFPSPLQQQHDKNFIYNLNQSANNFNTKKQIQNSTAHNFRYNSSNTQNNPKVRMGMTHMSNNNQARSAFNKLNIQDASKTSLSFSKCPSFIPKNQRANSVNQTQYNSAHSHLNSSFNKTKYNDPNDIKWIGTKPVQMSANFSLKNAFPQRKKKSGTQMLINMLVRHANRQQMEILRLKKISQQNEQKQNLKNKQKYNYLTSLNQNDKKDQIINSHNHMWNRRKNQKPLRGYFKVGFSVQNK